MSLVQRSPKGWARLFASRTFTAGALSLAVLGAGVVGGGCKHNDSSSSQTSGTLYERLGGEKAIRAVVDDFVAKAASDPAVNFTREGHPNHWDATPANVEKLKTHLVQFIAMATGGPQKYEGRSMAEVHSGMQISESEWNASVADLKYALDKNKVPQNLQDELIQVVATTHNDIVGR